MKQSELQLAELGYRRFVLYARPEAAAFYERRGYVPTGATAELIGFTHHEMVKPMPIAGDSPIE